MNCSVDVFVALCQLYDTQLANIRDYHYWLMQGRVTHIIDLCYDGSINYIIPAPVAEGKDKPERVLVPASGVRTSGVKPLYLYDKLIYVFGIGDKSPEERKKKHYSYLHYNTLLLNRCKETPVVRALKLYMENQYRSSIYNEAKIQQIVNEYPKPAEITFWYTVNGESVLKCSEIDRMAKYIVDTMCEYKMDSKWDGESKECGELLPCSGRMQDGIVYPNVYPQIGTGMNKMAVISYGGDKYKNLINYDLPRESNINQVDALKYTAALKYLLNPLNKCSIRLGQNGNNNMDIYLYYPVNPKKITEDKMNALINFCEMDDYIQEAETNKGSGAVTDTEAKIKRGKHITNIVNSNEKIQFEDDDDLVYTIHCATRINLHRVILKRVDCGHYAEYERNIKAHYRRCYTNDKYLHRMIANKYAIDENKVQKDKSRAPIDIYDFASVLLPESVLATKSSKGKYTIHESIAKLINQYYMAILYNRDYPISMMYNAVNRFVTNVVSNSTKKNNEGLLYRKQLILVMIIKGFLMKNYHAEEKGKDYMGLDKTNTDKSYLLGRLLALYAGMQEDALGSINRGVDEMYYKAAIASPQQVYSMLDAKATTAYMPKLPATKKAYYTKQIADIYEKMSAGDNEIYPATLSIEEKGKYILGYWHQKNAIYGYRMASANK